jgi:hypothetical protein
MENASMENAPTEDASMRSFRWRTYRWRTWIEKDAPIARWRSLRRQPVDAAGALTDSMTSDCWRHHGKVARGGRLQSRTPARVRSLRARAGALAESSEKPLVEDVDRGRVSRGLVENAPFESHNVETRLMEQASTVDSFIED